MVFRLFQKFEKQRTNSWIAKILSDSVSAGPIYQKHITNPRSGTKNFSVKIAKVAQDYSLCCFHDFRLVSNCRFNQWNMFIRPRGFRIRKNFYNPSIFSIFFLFSKFFSMKKMSCRRSRTKTS